MGSLWIPYGPQWIPYGFPMNSLWVPYGFPMDSLWIHYGIPMDLLNYARITYLFDMSTWLGVSFVCRFCASLVREHMYSPGFLMDYLWLPYGSPKDSLWIPYG